ncbi:MAG: phasin family protein [Actinomycetota bacterium]
MLDELRRVALFSSGVVELTRHQAEQVVKDLVRSGDLRRQQASTAAKELIDRSKSNRKELLRFVRAEIQNQIEALGLATKRDLDRLERRIARLESERKAQRSPAKKTSAKKTPAKKTSSKSSAAKSTSKSTTTRSGPS